MKVSMPIVVCLVSALLIPDARGDDAWVFSWHSSEVTGLVFTQDGSRLVSTSLRDDRVSQMVSEASPAETIGTAIGQVSGVRSHAVAISPNGKRIAIAGFKVTAVYDLSNGNEQWRIDTLPNEYSPPFAMSLAFSPDGECLAVSGSSSKVGGPHGYKGGLITIHDAESGRELHRFDELSHASESIAFSPNGKLFAAGTKGASGELPEPGELRVWDAETGTLLHNWKARDSVNAGEDCSSATGVAFSPDSRLIAVASSDRTVRLWDVASGKVQLELNGHRKPVRRIAFSPDGRLLASAGEDRTVRLWDVMSGQQVASLDVKAPRINAVTFSPNGMFLAVGGGDFLRMGEVRVWRVADALK